MLHEQTRLALGSLLRERYAIKDVLGSGYAGTVYLVRDQQLKRLKYNLFALKEIVGLDQQARLQFAFSGVSLRQVQHPVLPVIHHVFNDDKRDRVYMVIDYVEGSNLDVLRLRRPERRFNWSELQRFLEPLVGALTYLHCQEKPLVHGDIKPTNIIQSITGSLMLVDLGYVQAAPPELLTQTSRTSLSCYRAPEYFDGEVDISADVYSLAATAYVLLTGQPPVDALVRQKQVSRKKSDPQPLANTLVPEISEAQAQALRRALALNPHERFASVKEFWEVLKADSTDQPVYPLPISFSAARELTTPLPESKPARETLRAWLLPRVAIIGVLLLLLSGAGLWLWVSNSHEAPNTVAVQNLTPTLHSGYTPTLGAYPDILGSYTGILYPLTTSSSTITFNLNIQQQQTNQISGVFSSTVQKASTFTGTVDLSGNVLFTVTDVSGEALFIFAGGSNNSSSYSDTLGGTFSSCASGYGATCQKTDNGMSGTWTVVHQPTASAAPSMTGLLSDSAGYLPGRDLCFRDTMRKSEMKKRGLRG